MYQLHDVETETEVPNKSYSTPVTIDRWLADLDLTVAFYGESEESPEEALTNDDWLINEYIAVLRELTAAFLRDIPTSPPLSKELLGAFTDVREVEAIYVERQSGALAITVLLSSQQYDEALMDELLDIEYGVRQTTTDQVLSFRYIPVLGRDREEFVSPSAEVLFEAS